jgi:hypothetical protein
MRTKSYLQMIVSAGAGRVPSELLRVISLARPDAGGCRRLAASPTSDQDGAVVVAHPEIARGR